MSNRGSHNTYNTTDTPEVDTTVEKYQLNQSDDIKNDQVMSISEKIARDIQDNMSLTDDEKKIANEASARGESIQYLQFKDVAKKLSDFFEHRDRPKKMTLLDFYKERFVLLLQPQPDFIKLADGDYEKAERLAETYVKRKTEISNRYIKKVGLYSRLYITHKGADPNDPEKEVIVCVMNPVDNSYFIKKVESARDNKLQSRISTGLVNYSKQGYAGPLSKAINAMGELILGDSDDETKQQRLTENRKILEDEITENYRCVIQFNSGDKKEERIRAMLGGKEDGVSDVTTTTPQEEVSKKSTSIKDTDEVLEFEE